MSTKSILLIAHESSLREVLKTCLKELGHWKVTASDSIRQGIALCMANRPDAILLDTSTPEADALLFIERLKQYSIAHAIPILLITARAGWFTPAQFHEMGFAGVIAKPFDPATLTQQVASLVGWADDQST